MSDIEEKLNQIQELIKENKTIPYSLITDKQVLDSLSEEQIIQIIREYPTLIDLTKIDITKNILEEYIKFADDDDIFGLYDMFAGYDDIKVDMDLFIEAYFDRAIKVYENTQESEEHEEILSEYRGIGNRVLKRIIENDDNNEKLINFETKNIDVEKFKKIIDYGLADKETIYAIVTAKVQNEFFSEFCKSKGINKITLWGYTKEQSIDKFKEIINKNSINYPILASTRTNDKETIKYVFDSLINPNSDELFELYYNARKNNPNIVIPEILVDERIDFLNLEQFSRFTMLDDTSRRKIFNLIKLPYGIDILKSLCENTEDYINSIGIFVDRIDEYESLLEDDEFKEKMQDEFDKEQIISKLYTIVLSNSENHFGIFSLEDLEDYEELKKYEVDRILRNIIKPDNDISEKDGQFAILEALYGIDREEAERLVSKYGNGIDEIQTEEITDERITKNYIKALGNILKLKKSDISFLCRDSEFMKLINSDNEFSTKTIIDVDKKMRDTYAKDFESKMLKIKSNEEPSFEADYNGKKIKIYEIPRKNDNGEYEEIDFGIFARIEGAYVEDYEKPSNYLEYLSGIDMSYHGNCESYINQSMNSTARTNDESLMFLYNECDDILLSAPWDIISSEANGKFNTANVKSYEIGHPICFMPPDKLIDTTRHLHNEFVFERYSFDKETRGIKRRLPNFVGIDKEKADLDIQALISEGIYSEQLKACGDLDIPLLIINREALTIQEKNRIEKDLTILKEYDSKGNEDGRNYEEILRDILNRFENNSVGHQFHKSKEKYFNNEERKRLLKQVIDTIKKGDGFEVSKRFQALEIILDEEIQKQYSTKDTLVSKDEHFALYSQLLEKLKRDYPPMLKPRGNIIQDVKKDIVDIQEAERVIKEKRLIQLQHEDSELDKVIVMAEKVLEDKEIDGDSISSTKKKEDSNISL